MRPIYIVLRQSPDWAKQTYDDLEKTKTFCRLIGRPETFIIDRVLMWDKTFNISFFAARQMMKDISQLNFATIEDTVQVPATDIERVLDRKAFYLFTDDDDWYYPQIARHLSKIDPRACDVVLWLTATLGSGLNPMQGHYACSTNGYAVSGEVLLQKKGNIERVTQHFDAQAAFIRNSYASVLRHIGYASLYRRLTVAGYQSTVRLPHYLSVTNKHPASTLSLEEISTPEELITMITDGVAGNKKMCLPAEFCWAKPHIDRVTVFLEDLLASIR
jgi:hypothetical protein